MSSHNQSEPLKSLQELAASKAIEELLTSSNPAQDLLTFHEHQQKLVLEQLFSDHARLLEESNKRKDAEERTPYLDRQLYKYHYDRIREWGDEDEDEEEEESHPNGYVLRDEFLKEWHYITAADTERRNHLGYDKIYIYHDNSFDSQSLLSHGLTADLVICHDRRCDQADSDSHKTLTRKISSQLLYYRVTGIFGMPPIQKSDGYKTSWEARLVYQDGESSLYVGEWKGHAVAEFFGTKEAQESALALMNFLTGLNCPHTYDGIIAGTVA